MSQSHKQDGISQTVLWPFWFAGKLLLSILLLSLLSQIICVGAYHFQAKGRLDGEVVPITPQYMNALVDRAEQHAAFGVISEQIAKTNYGLWFKLSGIDTAAQRRDSSRLMDRIVLQHPAHFLVGMHAASLFGLRLGNVLTFIPLMLLIIGLATIDGLVERKIRTACAGHESATKFRFARRFAYTLLPPIIGIVFLCLPIDLDVGEVVFPALLITAVLVRMKWTYYKKHW